MKISQFTVKELDDIKRGANFTDLELACFNLKAKDKTNYAVAMELNVSESTVTMTMKSVRAKITSVLEQRVESKPNNKFYESPKSTLSYLLDLIAKFLENTPLIPESHTTREWGELPDKVSIKDKLYVVTDFRNDDDSPGIPRFKYGDGITMISQLPFCTAAITDNDVKLWDLQTQISQKNQ